MANPEPRTTELGIDQSIIEPFHAAADSRIAFAGRHCRHTKRLKAETYTRPFITVSQLGYARWERIVGIVAALVRAEGVGVRETTDEADETTNPDLSP